MNINKKIFLMFFGYAYSLVGMDVAPLTLLESIKKSLPQELVPTIKNHMLPTQQWWYCDRSFSHNAQVNSVSFSGDRFAVGLHNGMIYIFNAETGKEDASFNYGKWVFSVHGDNDHIAVGVGAGFENPYRSDNVNMSIFSLSSGKKCQDIPHKNSIFSVCLSGNRVATGSYDEACLFNIKTGKNLSTYKHKGEDKRVFSVGLDSNLLAMGFADGNICIINTQTGKKILSRKYKKSVQSVHLKQGLLAVGLSNGDVHTFDMQTNKKLISRKYARSSIKSVRLSGDYLVTGCYKGSIRIGNAKTGSRLMVFKIDSPLYSLDFDGNRIAAGLSDKSCIFKRHTDYTLNQLQLKYALTTWLLLEKPRKYILKLKKKEQMPWLFADVAKKCGLNYEKECVDAWTTFPINMQDALWRTMMHRIEVHGKILRKIKTQKEVIK
jgi:WD40 repeat protein